MLDILDAPMPFLVGLHSRYLQEMPPSRRPAGVVFVDLDHDIVHLGWSDEGGLGPVTTALGRGEPRRPPAVPEKDALKLKNRLATSAAAVYLLPDSGKAGSLTYGDGKPLPFGERDLYSRINSHEIPTQNGRRKEFFVNIDRAYDDNEIYTSSTEDFLSGQGLFHEKQDKQSSQGITANTPSPTNKRNLRLVRRFLPTSGTKGSGTSGSAFQEETEGGIMDSSDIRLSSNNSRNSNTASSRQRGSLLELQEPKGFSVQEIRNAFLKFFVGIFKGYRDFLDEDGTFRSEEFITKMNIANPRSHEFMQSVFGTQMFERFLQERIEDPDDPEVMFFDEAIGAKQASRFGKATFGRIRNGGGRKMDHDGDKATEKYTPPPPSHLGLPDDGRTYHYGSFPDLDPSLFGKVRHPVIWSQEYYQSNKGSASSSRIRTSKEIVLKQQSIVNGILGAPSLTGALSPSLALTHGPSALERALYALSKPFMESTQLQQTNDKLEQQQKSGLLSPSQSASKQKPAKLSTKIVSLSNVVSATAIPTIDDPPPSPEEVIMNSRRVTLIFVGIHILVQAHIRGFLARKRLAIEAALKEEAKKQEADNLLAAVGDEERRRHEHSVTILQRAIRRRQELGIFHRKTEAAKKFQALIRMFRVRCKFLCVRRGTLLQQGIARGRLTLWAYNLLRQRLALVQAQCRGHAVRAGIMKVLDSRLDLYRRQIFILWKRAHTSLAYRTKFWTVLEKVSYLRHNLADYELQRLWKELCLIEGMGLLLDEPDDSLSTLAAKLGLSNTTYIGCLTLDKSLDVDKDDDFSQVASLGSTTYSSKSYSAASSGGNKSFSSASGDGTNYRGGVGAGTGRILNSERTQIYERLSLMGNNEQELVRLYETFKIGSKVKKRKKSLAETMWRSLDLAKQSAMLMYKLFPELKNSDTLRFVEPSRKGIRRFRYDFTIPAADYETLRAQKVIDDRIRRNVSLVASVGMCRIPSLLSKLNGFLQDGEKSTNGKNEANRRQRQQEEKEKKFGSEQRRLASTRARGFQNWQDCSFFLMQALAENRLIGDAPPVVRVASSSSSVSPPTEKERQTSAESDKNWNPFS